MNEEQPKPLSFHLRQCKGYPEYINHIKQAIQRLKKRIEEAGLNCDDIFKEIIGEL